MISCDATAHSCAEAAAGVSVLDKVSRVMGGLESCFPTPWSNRCPQVAVAAILHLKTFLSFLCELDLAAAGAGRTRFTREAGSSLIYALRSQSTALQHSSARCQGPVGLARRCSELCVPSFVPLGVSFWQRLQVMGPPRPPLAFRRKEAGPNALGVR